MKVLVINAGSSSLKYQFIDIDTQAVLAKGLCETVKQEESILILRAEQGSEILTEILDEAGMIYTDVKIYDIHVDEDKRRFANEKAKGMDFITFASGSGVRGFMENGGSIPAGTKAVCIGSSTEKMLKKYGNYDKITAETFNVDGVVEAILQEVGK